MISLKSKRILQEDKTSVERKPLRVPFLPQGVNFTCVFICENPYKEEYNFSGEY